MTTYEAASGHWSDIQDAFDLSSAGDIVTIPSGTHNFLNVDEDWSLDPQVTMTPGVDLMGALTDRDENNQVSGAWKTILQTPTEVSSLNRWFGVDGTSQADENNRISDIELRGYRYTDNESTTENKGIIIRDIVNFRVDHCNFQDTCWGGLTIWNSSGLVDHCRFVNSAGYVEASIANCTVVYGMEVYRAYGNVWENDVTDVLGQYTEYSVFVEDSYFEKWRHCIASNTGAHYIFRYNIILNDYGFGSVDAHGWFQAHCKNPQHGLQALVPVEWSAELGAYVCAYEVLGNPGDICGVEYNPDEQGGVFYTGQVGTRATEIYENTITDAIQTVWGTMIRGGAGVSFNNTFGDGTYSIFMYLSNDMWNRPHGSKVWINDWYIWDNTMQDGESEVTVYDTQDPPQIVENVNYFKRAPTVEDDGFTYTPYTYPHSLNTDEEQEEEGEIGVRNGTTFNESLGASVLRGLMR